MLPCSACSWTAGRRRICLGFVALAGAMLFLLWLQNRTKDPIYDGRPVSEWVRMAFSEGRPEEEPGKRRQGVAWRKVMEIGRPAAPFVARGLTDANHRLLMRQLEWLRWHLPEAIRWKERSSCVLRHYDALYLLTDMGDAAQPAVPAVVRCFEECPCAHYMDGMACIEWLRDAGTTASNALPFLARLSRETNSYVLAAAVAAYYVSGETDENFLVETFCREAQRDPAGFLSTHEPFWFRHDPEVNHKLVPVLLNVLTNSMTDTRTRLSVVFYLHDCGTNALPALPALQELLRSSESAELREEVQTALPRILGQVTEEEEQAAEAVRQKKTEQKADQENRDDQ